MKKSKTYYAQLKPIVAKFVENFLTDFTTHDKRILRENKGCSFLYAIRKSGTNIQAIETLDTEEEIRISKIWILGYNKRFFHLFDGKVEEITKEEVGEIFDKRAMRLNPCNETREVIKTVNYCDIRPESDAFCYHKGELYGTRENLQYLPKKVRLC